ncbi:hypothetical protein L0Y69_01585 [bacterium]|nr:hypothetical protein [bacterium]
MHLFGLFAIFAAMMWYFQIDVRGFVDSHPEIKNSLGAGKDFIIAVWNNHIQPNAEYLWQDIWIDTIWKFIKGLIVNVQPPPQV